MTAPSSDAPEDLDRIVEEYLARLRAGEHPSLDDAIRRHPRLRAEIERLMPVLALLEGVKPGSAAADAAAEDPERDRPRRVGPYETVRTLGAGGMGVVYEARDPDGARVAVKLVHPHRVGQARALTRFLREVEIGKRIDHPNVVRTLGSGVLESGGGGAPYLVLEFVEGQNLRELLQEVGVVPERLCRHVALGLTRALGTFEDAGVVHRDVKPENILIAPDETVRLMDMGVARDPEAEARLTADGQFVGSFRYAAPEQMAGRDVDGRADLYALGVVLYELATGELPAPPSAAGEARDAVIRPSASNPAISASFDEIVAGLLEADPAARCPSARCLEAGLLEAGDAWWTARRRAAQPHRPAAQRLQLGPRLTTLQGREAEWQRLDDAWEESLGGEGRVVVLEGEAGIGKSRLLDDWLAARLDRIEGLPLIVARHGPGQRGLGLASLLLAVREALSRSGSYPANGLSALLGEDAPARAVLERWLRGDVRSDEAADALPASILALLDAWARAHGAVILVVEDLHFASPATRSLVRFLASAASSRPLLLLTTTRPVEDDDELRALELAPHGEWMSLHGLDESAARAVLAELFSGGEAQTGDALAVIQRADGNPFFLLELGRDLERRGPSRRSTQAPDHSLTTQPGLPDSLKALIGHQLHALGEKDRELLGVAACCGFRFDPAVLARAADRGLVDTLKALGRLERRRGILRSGRDVHRFRHHLLQEVLYLELSNDLRQAYHLAIGRALEQEAAGRATEEFDGALAHQVASHLLRSREPRQAAPHLPPALRHLARRAEYPEIAWMGEEALRRRVYDGDPPVDLLIDLSDAHHMTAHADGARSRIDQAMEIAERSGDAGLIARCHVAAGSRAHWAGLHEDALRHFREARALSQKAGETGEEGRALRGLVSALRDLARMDEALAAAQEMRRFAADHGDGWLAREGMMDLAYVQYMRGRLDDARALLKSCTEKARAAGAVQQERYLCRQQGQIEFKEGRFGASLAWSERTLELGHRLGITHDHVSMLVSTADCLHELGRLAEADEKLEDALRTARAHGDVAPTEVAFRARAKLRASQGRLRDAMADLDEARTRCKPGGNPFVRARIQVFTAEILGLLGRLEEAEALLDEVRARDDASGLPYPISRAHQVEGDLWMARADPGRAAACYERALDLREHGGVRHRVLDLALAKALELKGEEKRARELVTAALTWAESGGSVRAFVLARLRRDRMDGTGPVATRALLESSATELPCVEALRAWTELWEMTAESGDLRQAADRLQVLRRGAPPDDRRTLVENVAIHRRIHEAAERS